MSMGKEREREMLTPLNPRGNNNKSPEKLRDGVTSIRRIVRQLILVDDDQIRDSLDA